MTTATERFVRAAVEGGWEYPLNGSRWNVYEYGDEFRVKLRGITVPFQLEVALLDPSLWRCAAKTLGFDTWENIENRDTGEIHGTELGWKLRWHGLLDWLAEGKTAEAYLGTLLPTKGDE